MKYYRSTLDRTSRIITLLITLLFLGIAGHQIWLFTTMKDEIPLILLISVLTIIAFTYTVCYLYKTDGYMLSPYSIDILRPVNRKSILLNSIRKVVVPTTDSMRWTIRIFGNGGLFGYWGKFRNSTYGSMTWYATRRSNYILLFMEDDRKIVLTPDDISLAEAIQQKLVP